MLKPKLPQQNQGFTLVEVLVAILIASLFVAVAMQSIVLAAYFKLRAKQFTEATTLIQQDIEQVKFLATEGQLPYVAATCSSGYGAALQTKINSTIGSSVSKPIGGKLYWLTRNPSPNNQILQLTYYVVPDNNGSPGSNSDAIASIYTEVMPDAATECP